VEDVQDEPLAAERVAGTGIGKAMVMATVRVPGAAAGGRRRQETREFATTRRGLVALAVWLREWEVERAGMEATGDYWRPVLFTLEREGTECLLYQASRVKAMPGRPKTDRHDSIWLAKLTEQGSVQGSFIPPEEIRVLRSHTRYRRHLAQARTAEKQRAEKLLEDAHLKLSSVLSDIHGKSGRAMLEAIIAGERDPGALAGLALGRARRKAARLREALDCSFFTSDHAWLLKVMLARIDQYTAEIAQLTARIGELCQPWERQLAQLAAIPGVSERTAQDLIAETGVDMTRFPTPAHLASWARQAPAVRESAGHRKDKGAGRGNPYSGGALGEAAAAASRTQTFLGARYHRLIRHMPKAKAQRAIMRAILVIAWHLLSDPDATYNDLGHDYYDRHDDHHRKARAHARALERLGYQVTIHPQAAAS
jgi:transposase